MKIETDIRTSEVNAFLRTLESDQLPFATSLALNQTANDFQADQRVHMAQVFEIRRPGFMRRSVKIRDSDRATKQRPEVRIRIDTPGQRSDHIWTKFENETSKSPFRGSSIAVPSEHVPRTPTGVIQKKWRPKNLGLKQHGTGRVFARRGDVYRGERGTFMIRRPGGRGTIFRRQPGGETVVLYQLVPQVSITPVLAFEDTARRTVNRVWAGNFTRAFDRATGGRR